MLSDQYERRGMLISSNLLFSAVSFIFAVTDNAALLLASSVISGVSEAASSVSTNALLADKAGPTKRMPAFALALAFFSFSISLEIGVFSIPLVSTFEGLGYGEA